MRKKTKDEKVKRLSNSKPPKTKGNKTPGTPKRKGKHSQPENLLGQQQMNRFLELKKVAQMKKVFEERGENQNTLSDAAANTIVKGSNTKTTEANKETDHSTPQLHHSNGY